MAPDIENMDDVSELEKMLEVETVFEERKRIRARLRELRKKTKDVTEQQTTDRERRRRRREDTNANEKTSTDDRNNNINEKESALSKKSTTITPLPTTPVDNKPELKSPATPVDNKPELKSPATPVDNKPELKSPATPVDNKPPLSPNNNSTAITKEKPETKNTKVEEKSSVTDDGKTKTTTSVKKFEKDGVESITKSTVSKSKDGNTKSQTETTEEIVRHDGPCGFSYAKKSTITSSSSSSSSSSSKVPESQPLTSRKMSKFDEELARKKKEREEKRAEEAIKWKEQQAARNKRLQEQRKADQLAAKNKKANIMQMFGGKVESGSGSAGPPRMMVQNANSIKAKLLEWCKRITRDYPNVNIENFSRSWNNGMAFCAIIHHYFPGAFNFEELNPKQRRHNFDLAFQTAESLANIMPLLDTEDMLMMKDTPDWKCVFTYVQSLYRNLNGKPITPV